jgi:hypothetical protein
VIDRRWLLCLFLAAPAARPAAAQDPIYNFKCASGSALVGLRAWQRDAYIDRLAGLCAAVNVGAGTVSASRVATGIAGAGGGWGSATSSGDRVCPADRVLTRFAGSRTSTQTRDFFTGATVEDAHVLTIHALYCNDVLPGGMAAASGSWVTAFPQKSGGNAITTTCLDGRVASGINGRAREDVSAFSVSCDLLPGASTPVATAPPPSPPVITIGTPGKYPTPGGVSLAAPGDGVHIKGYQPGICAAVDPIPQFSWQAAAYATGYRLELTNDTEGRTRVYTATTTYRSILYLVLRAGNSYHWRVQGINASGLPGPWSGTRGIVADAAPAQPGPCGSLGTVTTF